MLYVKIMADQDMDDTDQWKHYIIVPVNNNEVMRFAPNTELDKPKLLRDPEFVLEVQGAQGSEIRTYPLTGNAYVMTESGKTIASHGARFEITPGFQGN